MNDTIEAAKNNPGVSALIAIILAGGGANFLSEGAEEEESEALAIELRQADIGQDERHDELDALFHDLDKRLAIIENEILHHTPQ